MKKLFVIAIVVLFMAPAALAQQTQSYSWENGGTILGFYGNLVDPTNVQGVQNGQNGALGTWTCDGPYDGVKYLHVAESPHDGTPQAYVAWITNLIPGDMVVADFWGWDTIDGSPSIRIWAHYATDDIEGYQGSAGEGINNTGYTGFTGWENVSSSWEFGTPAGYGAETSLVIELRLYSTPSTSGDRTDFWADLVTITAPTTAEIFFPEGVSAAESATWTSIKALYR